jgi:hypothetical protein
MIPQTPRHDFLRQLHELLRPATYLEIGVQTGRSLAQAGPRTYSVGVDPAPVIQVPIVGPNIIYRQTSDAFFAGPGAPRSPVLHPWPVDLAFIDGMHLVEYCLRDFMGVERLARPDGRTVAVFDDVLPYSADIAGRVPLPGDWAGDCWKIFPILDGFRHDLTLILVNVAPTGVLVALDLKPGNTDLAALYGDIVTDWACEFSPEGSVAHIADAHRHAVGPADALTLIHNHLEAIA